MHLQLSPVKYNYKYAVVTPNDIVIPPRLDDNVSED